ncbi:uncharacterized protein Fot_38600 [Forsythia ovata]|uniref:Uncharacterized protein n=1 Tax=Forsythia ovata TaxID=205694 RepID=A0ABD1S4Q2_9LAMI
MEPELHTVINLFDLLWFYPQIFKKQSYTTISSIPETNPDCHNQENPRKAKISSQLTIHTRSKSDQLMNSITGLDSGSSSPNSVLYTPHLSEQDFSQEISIATQVEKTRGGVRNRRKKTLSKSLSQLEFEELKGFMDLGFVFSEEDKDSSLVEIIPGLQRAGKKRDGKGKEEEANANVSSVPRPYLSEAWEFFDERKRENQSPLMNWRVPVISNKIDMKDCLKWNGKWFSSLATSYTIEPLEVGAKMIETACCRHLPCRYHQRGSGLDWEGAEGMGGRWGRRGAGLGAVEDGGLG